MRPPSSPRRAWLLRRWLALAALAGVAGAGAGVACGPNEHPFWICLSPTTGKLDPDIGDPNHYVDGVFDPCFCYDPCGPRPECPIVVDAGPPPPDAMCDAGNDSP
ncbi:MAG: hypothetical protein U0359_32620 [Byssovorax sp.]